MLESYLNIRSDIGSVTEKARDRLSALIQVPRQIADNSALALSILALNGKISPFAMEGAGVAVRLVVVATHRVYSEKRRYGRLLRFQMDEQSLRCRSDDLLSH